MNIATSITITRRHTLLLILCAIALGMLYTALPQMTDWTYYYRPSTLAMLRGDSPYSIDGFHNAPWALFPFVPLALLPTSLGKLGFYLLGFGCYAYIATRLSDNLVSTVLFLTSFPVVTGLAGGALDWFPMLALVVPPPLALIFAAIKPQVGFGVVLYWLWSAWEAGDIRQVVKWFTPVIFLLAASFVAYGFWPLTMMGKWDNNANSSIFPYLVPLGLYILWTKHPSALKASGIFFAPYHTLYSISLPLTVLFKYPRLMFAAWIVTWGFHVAYIILW